MSLYTFTVLSNLDPISWIAHVIGYPIIFYGLWFHDLLLIAVGLLIPLMGHAYAMTYTVHKYKRTRGFLRTFMEWWHYSILGLLHQAVTFGLIFGGAWINNILIFSSGFLIWIVGIAYTWYTKPKIR